VTAFARLQGLLKARLSRSVILTSVLFRKAFFVILAIFLSYVTALYFFSVPLIKDTVYRTEEEAAKTNLDNVYELVRSEHLAIEAYRESALAAHKDQLKNITLIQESFLNHKYQQFKNGQLTEQEAKRQALNELRSFRYGHNDYLWVSDYRSVLISHPDPKLHNADFSTVKDIYGNLIVPPMVQVARQNSEGYTTYWWRRLGEEKPIEKLTYSRHFPLWQWVIGTGVYIDDVEAEVARRREKMIDELRQILNGLNMPHAGYVYIFDSTFNMLVHPNPDLQGTNIASLLDPVTKKPLGEELKAAAHRANPRVYYKWDRPDDRGRYIHEKISWVRHFEPFDWYIASSTYIDELNSSANMLRNRILGVSAVMLVLATVATLVFVDRFLVPIRKLSAMAQKLTDGDLTVHCDVVQRDELGVLAQVFNGMAGELKSHIDDLDRKVAERTIELDEKNLRLRQEVDERERVTRELAETNQKLTAWVNELKQRNREIATLNQMGDMLPACRTMGEIFSVTAEAVEDLFVGESGALFMLNAPRTLLERVASWGDSAKNPSDFTPEACWCVRRGKAYRFERPGPGQSCEHVKAPPPYGSLCVPLIAHGEVWGVLHHIFASPDPSQSEEELVQHMESQQSLTATVSDHLGLAIANLRLRDKLRELSVRDPLTNLFNRRYMEETLERETKRARRDRSNLGVVMIDVDHFKRFNDSHGHDVGDLVLTSLATLLARSIREEDVACRYGGEEFCVLLPGADVESTTRRAEQMRQAVERDLRIDYRDQVLRVTVSMGVAVYPVHAEEAARIIEAADAALYRAKEEGRNRVVVSVTRVLIGAAG
jgi:diguanylate cyclase (GGDEF)-like protein